MKKLSTLSVFASLSLMGSLAFCESIAICGVAVIPPSSVAHGEMVQLPYQTPDENGNQWVVYYQGNLQMQGNQPVFSQAGMIQINGRQPQQPNNQQGNWEEKAKELSMTFRPQNNLKHERRFKFQDDGMVRILDIMENTSDKEQTLNIQFITNTNYGVNGADVIEDPKKKGDVAWVADTGVGRAAMSVFGGKGSKQLPSVKYQQGNNQVNANMSVKVGGKEKIVLVSWHGSFDNADAGKAWVQQARESRLVSDLPLDLRKAIVNISGTSAGSIGDHELLRGDTADVIELRGGDLIRGTLKVDSYQLNTAFGPITLPAGKVASILNIGEFRTRQLLVTQDGEVFGGDLQQQTLPIQLSSGQTTQVPLSQISRMGYRTGGAELPEWKFDRPMVFLRSGERCVIEPPSEPISFVTRYGAMSFAPEQVACVNLRTQSGVHEIYLADGSRMSGLVSNPNWPLKLATAAGDEPIAFPLAAISRVQLTLLPEDVGRGKSTLAMQGGDIVATRLEGQLKLQTTFDTLDINVQITKFDQSSFRGSLQTTSLKCKLVGGLSIDVPVAAIREYDNPQPFPSQTLVDQVKESVGKLSAEDWKDREAAEASLLAMGPTIISVLEESLEGQSADVKQRLGGVIKRLNKDVPASESRLSPPPEVE
jgi:hypothetical protein